jgi:hypothetical protein
MSSILGTRTNIFSASVAAIACFLFGNDHLSAAKGALNLLYNPSFEQGTPGPNSDATGWYNPQYADYGSHLGGRVTYNVHTGSWAYLMSADGYSTTSFAHLESTPIIVSPGLTYEASMWAIHRPDTASYLDSNRSALLKTIYYNSSGAEIASQQVTILTGSTPGNTWNQGVVRTVAPIGAVSLSVQFGISPCSRGTFLGGQSAFFDDGNVTAVVPSLSLTSTSGGPADLTVTGSAVGSYDPALLSFAPSSGGSKVISFAPANPGLVLVALDLAGSTGEIANLISILSSQGVQISAVVDPVFGAGYNAEAIFPVSDAGLFTLSFSNFGNVSLQGIAVLPEPGYPAVVFIALSWMASNRQRSR